MARAPDARTLCALEIPRRLWRALGEAGARPEGLAAPELSERWWVVEIEAPGDDEPNAIALWEADGAEVALAGFLCPGERGGAPFITVVTWRTSAEGERSGAGLAALRTPVHADDPDNPESRAGLDQIIETLTAPHTGPVARAKTAIALHLANNAQAPALGSYRPSAGSARARGDDARARSGIAPRRRSRFSRQRPRRPTDSHRVILKHPPALAGPSQQRRTSTMNLQVLAVFAIAACAMGASNAADKSHYVTVNAVVAAPTTATASGALEAVRF